MTILSGWYIHMVKIIGFIITKVSILPKFDFFKVGLNIIKVQHNNHYLYLLSIGDDKKYLKNYDGLVIETIKA